MKKHPIISQIEKFLKSIYYIRVLDENVMTIAVDKSSKDFAFITIEESEFSGAILSLALDFTESYTVADLVISLMHVTPIAMGETFYRACSGELLWEQDAWTAFQLEHDSDLLDKMETITDTVH